MTEYAYRVYESVANATSSELILFFVILAVVSLPLYIAILKGRKAERQHERERERHILDYIRENTEVLAGLKANLDNSGDVTRSTLERIHTRIDEKGRAISGVAADVAQVKTSQTEVASKVNKILLIVDNIPHNSNFSARDSGQ